jgi:hypothetical protein
MATKFVVSRRQFVDNVEPRFMPGNATKARFDARTNATKGLYVTVSIRLSARINDNARGCEQRRSQERVKKCGREGEAAR